MCFLTFIAAKILWTWTVWTVGLDARQHYVSHYRRRNNKANVRVVACRNEKRGRTVDKRGKDIWMNRIQLSCNCILLFGLGFFRALITSRYHYSSRLSINVVRTSYNFYYHRMVMIFLVIAIRRVLGSGTGRWGLSRHHADKIAFQFN